MEDGRNYESQKAEAQAIFAEAKSVRSPALEERVSLTAEGFNHIIFTGARRQRERASQMMRFSLLPRALRLIARSTTFQEYEETVKEVDVNVRKRRVREARPVRYWGIIAIFEGRKIKVILRKIGNGQLHFWSVVPAWTTNKYRDARFVSTMKGDPEKD